MQIRILAILIFLSSASVWAQDPEGRTADEIEFERERKMYEKLRAEESDIMLSRIYRRGPHLIYDCEDKHFACVSPRSRQRCEEGREADLKDKKLELSCAPLKPFDSTEDCERTQKNVMQRLVKKEFCWNLNQRTLYEF